jgi:hypothetical protein
MNLTPLTLKEGLKNADWDMLLHKLHDFYKEKI